MGTVAEGHLDANKILVDFSKSQLIIGGQHIPTRTRHGFDTLLSLASLACLHPSGITTRHFRGFLEPRRVIADPGSSARQAMLTLRNRNSGAFDYQRAQGSNRSPWSVRVNDGWKWVILDGPSQNNLNRLRAFVQGLE